jgi:acyl carrier protein
MTYSSEIQTILSEKLMRRVPSADADLLETGILDSMNFVDLVVILEERYGLTLDLASIDLEEFRSVSSIARLVFTLRNESSATQ